MSRLEDLISKAKTGRSVRDLLSPEAGQLDVQPLEAGNLLVDQIAIMEAVFFALTDDLQNIQLSSVLAELEQILTEI